MDNFNVTMSDKAMVDVCYLNNLESLINPFMAEAVII